MDKLIPFQKKEGQIEGLYINLLKAEWVKRGEIRQLADEIKLGTVRGRHRDQGKGQKLFSGTSAKCPKNNYSDLGM